MSTKKQIAKIDYAIYHDPSLIPILMRDTSIPKGLIYSRLRRTVPHRVGIEFEGTGEFLNHFLSDNPKVKERYGANISSKDVADYFGVREIVCDTGIGTRRCQLLGENSSTPQRASLEEVRVSINSFTQLQGLQKFLKELSKYLEICNGGGIHIHIDMNNYSKSLNLHNFNVINYLTHHLPEIESIFPKYRGHYNKRVVKEGKGSYVNLSYLDTLEFRIAPLTFDYSTLIQWIIKCNKIASKVINQCHLKINEYNDENRDAYKGYEMVDEDVGIDNGSPGGCDASNIYLSQLNSTDWYSNQVTDSERVLQSLSNAMNITSINGGIYQYRVSENGMINTDYLVY